MKYIFGTNRGAGAETRDGDVFITLKTDEELSAKIARTFEHTTKLVKMNASPLPLWLTIVKWIGAFAAALGLYAVIDFILDLNEKTQSFAQFYHRIPWLFNAAAVGAVLFIVLFIIEKVKKKQLRDSGEPEKAVEEALAVTGLIDEKFGIPEDSPDIDVIAFDYNETEDGIESNSLSSLEDLYAWRDGDDLKLALISEDDGASLYTLPIADMKGIAIERMGFNVANWSKTWQPDPKKHEVYGVKVAGQYGFAGLSYCCALDIVKNGETYRLLFPAYELEQVAELTGLPAPALPDKKELRAAPENAEKLRPVYYWKVPEGENVKSWFMPGADREFASKHPAAYVVLGLIALSGLFAPVIVYIPLSIPRLGNSNGMILVGAIGAFVFGFGLFNLVAAWIHQYLGHRVTIISIVLGAVLMALPFVI